MRRFTAKALLLVLTWGFFAPLAAALAPAPIRACCLRKTAHCHDHSQMGGMQMDASAMERDAPAAEHMDMGGSTSAPASAASTSVRAPNCCDQGGCCRSFSTGSAALNAGSSSHTSATVASWVSQQPDSPRIFASATSYEVRGPPAC